MSKKYLKYAIVPALAVAAIGIGTVSAHGWGMGFGGLFGGPGGILQNSSPDQIAQNQQDRFQTEADILGISVDDVKNAWAQGEGLQQLAQDKGITADQLQQKLKDYRSQQLSDYLNILVDQGVITRDQADQRLSLMNQQTTNESKGWGRHGMFMGGMMGW